MTGLLGGPAGMRADYQRMAPAGLLGHPAAPLPGHPVTPNQMRDPTQDRLDIGAGLLGMVPVAGDVAGLAADVHRFRTDPESRTPLNYGMSALGLLPFVPGMAGMTVFHGSPHRFDRFDMSKIGTGEGAQAYGHGIYLAERPGVASSYKASNPDAMWQLDGRSVAARYSELPDNVMELARDRGVNIEEASRIWTDEGIGAEKNALGNLLSYGDIETATQQGGKEVGPVLQRLRETGRLTGGGNLYEVDLPDEAIGRMLDWDAPLSEQPEAVREALRQIGMVDDKGITPDFATYKANPDGEAIVRRLEEKFGRDGATDALRAAGVPGVRYWDGTSRAAGQGTRNFVVFDDSLPQIVSRNNEPIGGLLGP